MIEHQLGAYTDCNHGMGLAALHPAYYRHIAGAAPAKFARFAQNVWGISAEGQTQLQLAFEGIEALASYFFSYVGMTLNGLALLSIGFILYAGVYGL